MSILPLTCLQYAYGKYVTNLVIQREILFIVEDNNFRKLNKLKGRIKFTQLIMPSKYSTDYKRAMPYYLENEVRYDETVFYLDRHDILKHGDEEKDGIKGFIEKVHICCVEYLSILEKVELTPPKSTNIEKKIKNLKEELTLDDIYDFLELYFKIDVKKELFTSEENSSSIIISGLPIKLSNKELTKYQIGYLFDYLFKKFSHQRSRIMFTYKGQGQKENIEYLEAIRALNDKRKEIISGKTTSRNLVKFADNLEKEFNFFTDNNKTL